MSQTEAVAIEIPPEVQAFAREQQVEAYLPTLLELVQHHFPCPDLRVELDVDPEVEDLRRIVFSTGPVEMSVDEALEAKDCYHRAVFAQIPAPFTCHFCLGLELA
jgi:hypothetical protein